MKEDYNCSIKSSCFGLKSLQLCLLFLLYGSGVFSQVTIPTANTNTANNRKPLGTFYGFERTAAIYTAAEHGMSAGSTVTSVCFYVDAITTPSDSPVVIYMSTTTATTFTATTYASEIAGATTVFSGTITGTSLVAGSWRCITLTTPFIYTGNNLKIIVETNSGGSGNETSTAKQFRWSAGASQTWQADTAAPTGTGTVSTTSRPNVQLSFTSPVGPGTLEFSAATFNGNEGTSAVVTVNRVGGFAGAVSVNFATSNGTATSGLDYTTTNGILNWTNGDFAAKTFSVPLTTDLILDPAETIILTLSNAVGTTITGTNPATLTIVDIPPPLTGTYTVGTGGNFTSLTNTGGIFEALNISGASSNITINIISDITGELGNNALNEIPGGFTILIQPVGTARTVTGSNSGGLIKFNGTDGVTINGSTTGATVGSCLIGGDASLRELTFVNTNVGTSAVVLSVQSGTNGASNNTIKNVNIIGQDLTTTLVGIALGGNTPGSTGLDNDNNKIENCSIQKVIFGIYSGGASLANQNIGTVISQNDLSATGLNRVRRVGIVVFNESGSIVGYNNVSVETNENADALGISLGTLGIDTTITNTGGITGALVNNNKINGVISSSITGYSAAGIAISGAVGGFNTIQNNMINGVTSPATAPDLVAGIFITGVVGSDTRVYNNTVSMTGDRGAVADQTPSFGVAVTGVDPTVDFRNNIIFTEQIASGGGANAKSYAFGMVSSTFANLNSNYNDYFSTGGAQDGGFRTGSLGIATGTDYVTISNWATAVSDEANSIEVLPVFVSPTDLHLNTGSNTGIDNLGTPIATVTNDFDCGARSATTPDMGADEINFLSVNNLVNNDRLNAYPNPVNNFLNIKYIDQISEITIFNMLGQEVFAKKINDDTAQIDMSSFNLGTYIVKVSSVNGSNTIKVVKR